MKPGKNFIGIGCGAIIINDNNEILLVKRSENSRTEPNTWSRPGGEVNFGETVEQAVEREVEEETGIKVKVLRFLEITQIIDKENNKHWIALGFLAKHIEGEPKNLEPEKHDDIKWFPLNQLPENINSYTKNAVDVFLKSKN